MPERPEGTRATIRDDSTGAVYEAAFWPEPISVTAARGFARAVAPLVGHEDVEQETVALLVSELATNAVIHAKTPFEVLVRLGDGVVRWEVHDEAGSELHRPPTSQDELGGRGLQLVEALARRWGIDQLVDGKTVWFEVPASRP